MTIKLQSLNHSQWNALNPKPAITLGFHASPWGNLVIVQSQEALCGLFFQDANAPRDAVLQNARKLWPGAPISFDQQSTAHWVDIAIKYLSGMSIPSDQVTVLSFLLLGTPFQLSVWTALSEIPFGQVVSYKDIASRIGRPKAVRAVGSAIGRNKISILIPCHRVIQSSGNLGGYAWGLDVKQALIDFECKVKC